MTDEKFIELARLIDDRTTSGAMKWEETGVDSLFQATLSKFVIRIKASQSNFADEIDYEISIMGRNGTMLESFSDMELSRILKNHPNAVEKNGYILMDHIFKNAKRTALGIDKAIDDVLKELNDLPPF